MIFADTEHCRSRAICRECRSSSRLRADLSAVYEWDGSCPMGLPINHAGPFPATVTPPPILLGDRVRNVLHDWGMDRLVRWLGGQCGCEARRMWLNRLDQAVRLWRSNAIRRASEVASRLRD